MVIILLSNMSSGDAYFGITYLQYVGGPGKIKKSFCGLRACATAIVTLDEMLIVLISIAYDIFCEVV